MHKVVLVTAGEERLPAGTAEERLTDLGAWCPPCYVPDMRYQPDGTLLFVR